MELVTREQKPAIRNTNINKINPDDEIDLLELWNAIWHRIWLVLLAIVILLAGIATWSVLGTSPEMDGAGSEEAVQSVSATIS